MNKLVITLSWWIKALCISAIPLIMLPAQDSWAQNEKEKKEKKKAKLPPEDLTGKILENAKYNFSVSTLNGKKKDKTTESTESLAIQAASVGTGGLAGLALNNPTSLQFGPDERLYVSQQNGLILALTIVRNAASDYEVTASETISLINQIPNYNDDGSLNTNVKTRQVTGILLSGTATNPIIYVSSSDSRIGGGSTKGDVGLDTNSGIISRLTKTSTGWEKIDLVRGLPRSEENHSVNGMQLDEQNNILYLAVGGFTNAGSPSNNFAFITEYALAAAILSIDLNAIDALPTQGSGNLAYKYDLPTLDDPTRPNNPDGSDPNDPFGGNDGLNQAKIIEGGPVQIYSPGYRNAYDVVITKTPGKEGRMYTIDNGANQGWGGHPENEGSDGTVTNNYVEGEPGSTGPGPNDPKVNNLDNLHYIGDITTYVPGSHYGGHPTPTRANLAGAGLYTHDGSSGVWRSSTTGENPLPADWPPVPLALANPIEGDFQNPGETDLALLTFKASTNGVVEYTASNFDNVLKGHLLTASFDGKIHKITLTEDGTDVTNTMDSKKVNGDLPFASGFGSQPLDVTAQGDNDIFPGTVWAATYGADAITIFEPEEYVVCTGEYSTSLDDDNDGYSNADEIDNATNPCSGASMPPDADGDLLSDLNDADDDNDGIGDDVDFFALDADNGLSTNLPVQYDLFNEDPGTGLFGVGFTGLMSNQQIDNDYNNLFDEDNLIAGGAVGAFSVVAVSPNDALGTLNNQENAFQFGINVHSGVGPFTLHGSMLGPFFDNQIPLDSQSQGIYIGTGDQDNYLKVVLNANNGQGGIEVVYENAGTPTAYQFNLEGGIPGSNLDLFLSVNPVTGTVQPKYSQDGGEVVTLGTSIQLSGVLLNAVQSTPALAVGIISTSRNAIPFTATWDFMYITVDPITATGQWQTIVPDSGSPTERHENAFVQAGDRFYLMGGREIKPVQAYDPVNKLWVSKANTPIELHHFQAVSMEGLIYIAGAFTGGYPYETPVPNIYIYNPLTDQWIEGPVIPEERRRGSAGVVVHNKKIYLVSGIIEGHNSGHVTWFDEYDPATNTWQTLPDAPRARDHFHAVVVNNKLYMAGGRRSSYATGETFSITVPEVDVFDFETGTWSTLPSGSNIPTQRAGSTTAVLGEELIVIGGESVAQSAAHKETEALNINTQTWRSLADLQTGRHGTQAIVNNNGIYIVAGSGSRGGSPELSSMEAFYMFGPTTPTGTALNQSDLSVPADLTFEGVAVNASSTKLVTLTNTGSDQSIIISSIDITGSNTFSYATSSNLPLILPVGESLDVSVTFNPTDSDQQSATLTINHSGTGGSATLSLSGRAVSEDLVADPNTLHFFSQQAGTISEAQTISITNNASTSIEISAVEITGTNNGEFTHDFIGPITLNVGGSTPINVVFQPLSLGTKVAELSITHTGANSPLSVSLTGEGIDNTGGNTASPVYLNSGGGEYTSGAGIVFAADQYHSSSRTYSKTSLSIAGTTDDVLYQTERTDKSFSYSIPVASSGTYRVRLHLAEIYWTSTGKRVFSVTAEGQAFLTDYDIVADVGAATAVVKETDVEVTDGTLNLSFTTSVDNAKVSAIEVVEPTNQAPLVDAGADQTIKLPANTASFTATASDSDGSIASYAWTTVSSPVGSEVTLSGESSEQLGVSVDLDGSYNFQVTVTDNEGATASDQVQLTVVSNYLPVADAGADQSVVDSDDSGTEAVTLDGSGSNDTDGTISSYSWAAEGVEIATGANPTVDLALGSHIITLTVTDDQGASNTDDVVVTVNPAFSPVYLNSGGGEYTSGAGIVFAADQYHSSSRTYSKTSLSIAGTTDDVLYQTERTDKSFSYSIPVASSGTYRVRLHLAEIYWTSTGKRVFSVTAEGQAFLTDYDIVADVGAATAVVKETDVEVTDGTLNLSFTTSVDNAKVSAIEVVEGIATNQPPVVANPIADQSTTAGEVYSYTFAENTFSDGDGDVLSYTASLSDDSALPLWLSFDGASRTFSGTASSTDVGIVDIKVTASDGIESVSDVFSLTVEEEVITNQPPVVANPIADQSTTAGEVYSYTFAENTFSDGDGDVLSYTASLSDDSALPLWLSFDGASRTFSGTASSTDVGIVDIKVTASDGIESVSDVFSLTVEEEVITNQPPVVANPIADQSATAGEVYSYTFAENTFSDGDGDVLSYTASLSDDSALPLWLSFDGASRTFSGTASSTDVGIVDIKVTASDGIESVSDVFSLTVEEEVITNQPPVVANPIADQSATAGEVYSYTFAENTFSDGDGDVLSYTASLSDDSALPSWLSFDGTSRTFSGTASSTDVGILDIKVTASDGIESVSDVFSLTVLEETISTRINSGSGQMTAYGVAFDDDKHFNGGRKYTNNQIADIVGTSDDDLYKTERYGSFSYEIPVSSATYLIRLHFAEIYFGATGGKAGGVGSRVFNVEGEGQSLLTNFDIFAEVGAMTAMIKEFELSVTDGTLNLNFISVVQNPKVSAIEVVPSTSSTSLSSTARLTKSMKSNTPEQSIISEVKELSEGVNIISIYPNPFDNKVNVVSDKLLKRGVLKFSVISEVGVEMQIESSQIDIVENTTSLYLTNLQLSVGVYILKIENTENNNIIYKRIIKVY
ncbi:malectin domain-containing carbohydrate-binding protein [Catalinimonas sp. 4WD22]|uniref:malectin domain-containing carbohydrate-binding protein n=1 Tax=Catalinimonas locisalis TaxID=3133978 RepID=UPI0031012907